MCQLTLFLVLIPFCLPAQTDCTLRLDKDSIRVYTCPRPDSRYKTIKTVLEMEGTLSELASALLDIDHLASWQYKTTSARILKKVSDLEVIYHTEVDAPALTSNRDFVIRLTIDPDPMTKGMIIEMVSIPEYIPPAEGVIRVPFSRAKWIVTPAGKRKLQIDYTLDIDLGGSVPPWVVNLFSAKAPYETFSGLRSAIAKYKGKRMKYFRD